MNRLARLYSPLLLVGTICFYSNTTANAQSTFDEELLVEHVRVLAADSLEGRRVGTEGAQKARGYIFSMYEKFGLLPFGDGYEQSFTLNSRQGGEVTGINLVGYVEGSESPESFIVITAHYDHLGVRNGNIFNGADDNASGTAGLLALLDIHRNNTPKHSVIFAALDAEEAGLQGARAFVDNPPVPLDQIRLNVNLDMISRNEKGEIFVAGTHHYPYLKPYIEDVAASAPLTVRFGHDEPGGKQGDDWTNSSDHGPFHQAGIPFVYFGVEDHPDYHRHTDEFENIDPAFLIHAVETVSSTVRILDHNLDTIHSQNSN